MKNAHIIVDPVTRRCLCGTYRTPTGREEPVTCRQVLDSAERLQGFLANCPHPEVRADVDRLAAVLKPLVEEC